MTIRIRFTKLKIIKLVSCIGYNYSYVIPELPTKTELTNQDKNLELNASWEESKSEQLIVNEVESSTSRRCEKV